MNNEQKHLIFDALIEQRQLCHNIERLPVSHEATMLSVSASIVHIKLQSICLQFWQEPEFKEQMARLRAIV